MRLVSIITDLDIPEDEMLEKNLCLHCKKCMKNCPSKCFSENGKDIYKIGMTRRLEPMDRIKELSSASVPFEFDVHAMIFSDNAPELEATLHKYFEKRSVNRVNLRKEFFNVTLDEIESIVKSNYNNTVEFTKIPAASEYRQTLEILKNE